MSGPRRDYPNTVAVFLANERSLTNGHSLKILPASLPSCGGLRSIQFPGDKIPLIDFVSFGAHQGLGRAIRCELEALSLQLRLQLPLEGLHVRCTGLIAFLRGFQHQAAILIQRPFA